MEQPSHPFHNGQLAITKSTAQYIIHNYFLAKNGCLQWWLSIRSLFCSLQNATAAIMVLHTTSYYFCISQKFFGPKNFSLMLSKLYWSYPLYNFLGFSYSCCINITGSSWTRVKELRVNAQRMQVHWSSSRSCHEWRRRWWVLFENWEFMRLFLLFEGFIPSIWSRYLSLFLPLLRFLLSLISTTGPQQKQATSQVIIIIFCRHIFLLFLPFSLLSFFCHSFPPSLSFSFFLGYWFHSLAQWSLCVLS